MLRFMGSQRVGHRLKRLSSSSTHGQIPFSLLKGLIREENLRRKHCRGCAANVNSNSLRDGGPGGFLKKLKDNWGNLNADYISHYQEMINCVRVMCYLFKNALSFREVAKVFGNKL